MTVREWFRKCRAEEFRRQEVFLEIERIAYLVDLANNRPSADKPDPMLEAELILEGLIQRLERRGTYNNIARNTGIFWRNNDIIL